MLESIVIGILTGLVTGVLSGYYSGLVVSRTSRFNALIRDAERALKNIEYMQEGHRAKIWGFERHAIIGLPMTWQQTCRSRRLSPFGLSSTP